MPLFPLWVDLGIALQAFNCWTPAPSTQRVLGNMAPERGSAAARTPRQGTLHSLKADGPRKTLPSSARCSSANQTQLNTALTAAGRLHAIQLTYMQSQCHRSRQARHLPRAPPTDQLPPMPDSLQIFRRAGWARP